MAKLCLFCGSSGQLTREHVFGQWVSKIGLDLSPVKHMAGPLNGLGRSMGTQPPYRQTVKVCSNCNNGWMSRLEMVAQRVLTPLILGEVGVIEVDDQPAIAMWIQKTALAGMLLSSQEDRDSGYGFPPSEYRALYNHRNRMLPLEASRFWIGRYCGDEGFSAIRVTPLAVRIQGIPEPKMPQAFIFTIVLGNLVMQGLRFVAEKLEIDMISAPNMRQIWPCREAVSISLEGSCDRDSFLCFADGKKLQSTITGVKLSPWSPAVNLPQSKIVNGMVELPLMCGKHVAYYPLALLQDALYGRFYVFATMCECSVAYLIKLERDGAHCRAAGDPQEIAKIYEEELGEEVMIGDHGGSFFCKYLP